MPTFKRWAFEVIEHRGQHRRDCFDRPEQHRRVSASGTHARGPQTWFSSIIPKERITPIFKTPNSAPATLLANPQRHQIQGLLDQFGQQMNRHHNEHKRQGQRRHMDGVDGPMDMLSEGVRHHM